jgi:hypothetical protein
MDLVGEFIKDPRFEEYMIGLLKKKDDEDMNREITEDQAMDILSKKGRKPSGRTMARYRAQQKDALPYIPGKPISYIRKHVLEFRDKNFVVKRNNF